MSAKATFITSLLVALDVVSGLNFRALEPLSEGTVVGYSLPDDGLFKRQTGGCPIGTRQCARTQTQIFCSGVCCYEDGEFVFGCDVGYRCDGTGANAGCCPIGRICTDSPPPCADFGEPAPSPTSVCPEELPTCTTNARGAPICSGILSQTNTRSFTITRTDTVSATFTSEPETETETETTIEIETTTTEVEPTPTTTTTTEEETSTSTTEVTVTITDDIPEETTTTEVTTTEVETTTVLPTITSTPTQSNATLTPLPPATSNSGRMATVNLLLGLISVAFAFFLF